MSVTSPRVLSTDTVVASPALAAETIIARLDGISTRGPGGTVILQAKALTVIGVGGTAITYRIRRGTTTADTQVASTASITAAAGSEPNTCFDTIDTPGEVADQPYVLTAQVTAATAASQVELASLTALY